MILASIRWLLSFPINLGFTILTVTGAPLWALFCVTRGDNRQYLIGPLKYLTTPDSGPSGYAVDEWWRGGYYKNAWGWSKGWTDADFQTSAWKRYVARVMWLIRNPAYGVAWDVLGFDKGSHWKISQHVMHGKWDSDATAYEWFVGYNPDAKLFKTAFSLSLQWPWSKSRYLRLWIGWKIGDNKTTGMLADHFNPMRPR